MRELCGGGVQRSWGCVRAASSGVKVRGSGVRAAWKLRARGSVVAALLQCWGGVGEACRLLGGYP